MSGSGAQVQLPLAVALRDSATFGSFYAAGNEAVVHALRAADEAFVYFWGVHGAGKSHLLQAVCHHAVDRRVSAGYLPQGERANLRPAALDGFERQQVVCLDDLHAVAGLPEWETALFNLFNGLRERGGRLVVAAEAAPAALKMGLPDLSSRLASGAVFRLAELDDAGKVAALQHRARRRGFEMPDAVAEYLLSRCPRDTYSLFALLERLDHASLAAQRRLTIPFVRTLL
ncbi:MAG: DnaA regulatory inactivator Hda [Pseudomonadota bacterium]|nr:MAG: DnaA regulatory inactivator Hda [Pseudomonadota bacterium]